jgi:hypothetical protein
VNPFKAFFLGPSLDKELTDLKQRFDKLMAYREEMDKRVNDYFDQVQYLRHENNLLKEKILALENPPLGTEVVPRVRVGGQTYPPPGAEQPVPAITKPSEVEALYRDKAFEQVKRLMPNIPSLAEGEDNGGARLNALTEDLPVEGEAKSLLARAAVFHTLSEKTQKRVSKPYEKALKNYRPNDLTVIKLKRPKVLPSKVALPKLKPPVGVKGK